VVGIARVGDGVQVGDAFVRWVRSRSAMGNGRAKKPKSSIGCYFVGMTGGKRV
jgi:hypothetical protein